MMGKTSRIKGYRGEKYIRDLCKQANIPVVWQAEDPHKPDIRIGEFEVEIKNRASVPLAPYQWIEEKQADIIMMKRSSKKEKGKKWLVVMDINLFFSFLKKSNYKK